MGNWPDEEEAEEEEVGARGGTVAKAFVGQRVRGRRKVGGYGRGQVKEQSKAGEDARRVTDLADKEHKPRELIRRKSRAVGGWVGGGVGAERPISREWRVCWRERSCILNVGKRKRIHAEKDDCYRKRERWLSIFLGCDQKLISRIFNDYFLWFLKSELVAVPGCNKGFKFVSPNLCFYKIRKDSNPLHPRGPLQPICMAWCATNFCNI